MKIRFIRDILHINENKINFTHDICGLIELNNLIIVLIYGASAKQMETLPNNNIYAFDEKGKKIWQIQPPFQVSGYITSYSDVILRKDGKIIAGTSQGLEYIVNIEDGSVIPTGGRPW